jgi:hypothetical protein
MMRSPPVPPDEPRLDPAFLHARREALYIFLAWCVALLWSVSVSYGLGYGQPATTLATVWGIPAWVFWGIAVPWAVADVFALWFCFRYMKDDDVSGRGSTDAPSGPQRLRSDDTPC